MKIATRTVAWLIAILVALQAASIAYVLMSVGHLVFSEGQTLDQNTEVGGAGFALHAVVGMQIIPALSVLLLILALVSRSRTTIWLSAAVLVAVIIQIFLGMFGGDMPALGWFHGLVAFVIFVLAGMTGQRATDRTRTRTTMAASA